MEKQQKKPYTPPTVTVQGNAVKETRGLGGRFLESYLNRNWSDFEVEDED